MEKRKSYIWMGIIPDIFGYGLIVVDKSEELVLKALKKNYYRWKKQYPSSSTFDSAFEEWGGRTEKIELGKVYNDDFN